MLVDAPPPPPPPPPHTHTPTPPRIIHYSNNNVFLNVLSHGKSAEKPFIGKTQWHTWLPLLINLNSLLAGFYVVWFFSFEKFFQKPVGSNSLDPDQAWSGYKLFANICCLIFFPSEFSFFEKFFQKPAESNSLDPHFVRPDLGTYCLQTEVK